MATKAEEPPYLETHDQARYRETECCDEFVSLASPREQLGDVELLKELLHEDVVQGHLCLQQGSGEGEGYVSLSQLATFLEVRVTNTHTICSGTAKFTDYEIRVKTSLSGLEQESVVRRRYSEFEWLHGQLAALGCAKPPALPAKKAIGRFDAEFVRRRARGLERFLYHVVSEAAYRAHPALRLFLQSPLSVSAIAAQLHT
eukprot:Colp12_sorted_trinity150504_noHs@26527